MRPSHRPTCHRPTLAARLAPLLLLLPSGAAAAPQGSEDERRIHREVVVVGSHPAHRQVVVDPLARRGYLGVQLIGLTPELRLHFGGPREAGVLVSRVPEDGPAAAAGVRVGDVITSIDGEPVRTVGQLAGRVGGRREGDRVEIELVRERSPMMLGVTVEESQRRQVEVGQFVWQGDGDGPMVLDLGRELDRRLKTVDPDGVERIIAVDRVAIDESVGRLLERLEAGGGRLSPMPDERRRQLEERIAELEERLRAMERLIHRGREATPPEE